FRLFTNQSANQWWIYMDDDGFSDLPNVKSLGFWGGGNNVLVLDGVTEFVGIGTGGRAPTEKLEVVGNILATDLTLGNVTTPTDLTADGKGITLKGTTNKTILWDNATDSWDFNQNVGITGNIVVSGTITTAQINIDNLTLNGNTISSTNVNGTILLSPNGTGQTLINNEVSIGGLATPATGASLDLKATNRALLLNRLTTTQRDALTPVAGMTIFNTTLNEHETYNGTSWITENTTLRTNLNAANADETGKVLHITFNDIGGGRQYDRSPRGNDALPVGGITVDATKGRYASGASFDGTNDYYTITQTTGFPIGNAVRSVEALVKTNTTAIGIGNIFSYGQSAGNNVFSVQRNGSALRVFTLADSVESASGVFVSGQWHKIQVIYNGTTVDAYVDGVKVINAATLTATTNTAEAVIGNRDGAEFWSGNIDYVRMYDRVLADNEIATDFLRPTKVGASVIKSDDLTILSRLGVVQANIKDNNLTVATVIANVLGGTATTSDLILQTTSGVGVTGADMHFLVGNNGGAEALTILNSGAIVIPGLTTDGVVTVSSGVLSSIAQGSGGGLDADTLDGLNSTQFLRSDTSDTFTSGILNFLDGTVLAIGTGNDLQFFHDGTHTIITSATGNLQFNNTDVNGQTFFQLGTDTNATSFFVINSSGKNLFHIEGSGNVGIGISGPESLFHVRSENEANFILQSQSESAGESDILFKKSRGAGTPTVIASGDRLGRLTFIGHDGTDFNTTGAYITAVSEGTIATGKIPAYLEFSTMNNAGVLAERMRITADGRLEVGGHIWQTALGNSVFIGEGAGANDNLTSNDNVAVGYNALNTNIIGYENIAIGHSALFSNIGGADNVAIGKETLALNTEGNEQVAIGYRVLYSNTTGDFNTAVGAFALANNTIGNNNVAVGRSALLQNTTGGENICIGHEAGWANTTGSGSVFIGHEAGFSETSSNRLYIHNSNTTTPLIYGEFDNKLLVINGTLNVDSGTLYVDRTTDFVGIGTTTPAAQLTQLATTPEHRLISSGDNNNARITRTDTLAKATRFNTVKQPMMDPYSLELSGYDPGTNDYVLGGNIKSSFTTEATLSMWVKLDNQLPTWPNNGIWTLNSISNQDDHYPYTNGDLNISAFATTRRIANFDNTSFDKTQWHHLALTTKPGSGNYKLYQNGVFVTSGTGDDVIDFGTTFKIGGFDNIFLDGLMDDVRIYNRELSQAEITTLAAGGDPSTTGLLVHWKLNEGSGTVAIDSSGNGNNGTFVGSPTYNTSVPSQHPGPQDVDAEAEVWVSQDGVAAREKGIHSFGDPQGTTVLRGKKAIINGGLFTSGTQFTTDTNTAALGLKYLYASTNSTEYRTFTISSADIARATPENPWYFMVKEQTGTMVANGKWLNIDTEGIEEIDGAANAIISVDWGVVRLYSDGGNLFSW
ncbi:hypothetical protein LCGC14_1108980, partial [marine sediment metagenome]